MIKFNSLKSKIVTLLAVTSLSIAFILFYIFINFYKKDKIAYIFENNSSFLASLGEEFKREVDFSSEIIKVHLENIKKTKKLTLNDLPTLKSDYFVDSISIYNLSDKLNLLDQIKKENKVFLSESEINQVLATEFLNNTSNNDQIIKVKQSNVTIVSKMVKENQTWILIYQFTSNALSDFFKKAESFNIVLSHKKEGISHFEYHSADKHQSNQLNLELTQKILPTLIQSLSTQIIKINNENYLFSSLKLSQSQNFISIFISENRALENLKSLFIKSIFFFILISAIVIFISYFSSDYLTHRLKKLTQSAKRIANGQFDEKITDNGHDEISTLTSGFNQMSTEIARLLNETAHKARMESELKTAQIVQSTLLPNNSYESNFISIKGCYTSASECGGDWWHYYENENFAWVWIADATGHGAPAALLTSAAKSAVSIIENLDLNLEHSFQHLNYAICNVSKENMMMTSFVAVINKKTLLLEYINASHEPSILIKKQTEISKDDLIFLNETINPRLGQSKTSRFISSKIQLDHGDRIFFYTDGVTDIRSPQEKIYGERSLVKELVKTYNSSSNLVELFEKYETSLNAFRSNTELIDDVTYCFFEIK